MMEESVSTFHSVYISTKRRINTVVYHYNLHSTLFILVRNSMNMINVYICNLHSTLFILVRFSMVICNGGFVNLHSTLFILVRIHES